MAKKTFETTIKTTITSNILKSQLWLLLPCDDRHDILFKKFAKTYDWDAILNSTKFNKYVASMVTEGNSDPEYIVEQYFMDHDETEFYKINKLYLKFVDENKKQEPTLTVEYRVVLTGTQQEIKESFDLINNSTCAESIDIL
jgi:hypothetical protein